MQKYFLSILILLSFTTNFLFAQFIQQGSKIVGSGFNGTSSQGYAVSISADGNTAVVGGKNDSSNAGAVWVFTRSNGVWTQQGSKLTGTGAVGNAVQQGCSVAISGDGNTLIFGGVYDNNAAGAVWVFTRSGGVWTQQGSKLVGTGATGYQPFQGTAVSMSYDGNTFIESGTGDSNGVGAVWVFTRSGGVWSQQGSKLFGTGATGHALQGTSISLSGDGNTAVVGGIGDNNYVGAVWVFTRSGNVWSQQGSKLVGTGSTGNAGHGLSVSISSNGNTIVESGSNDNSYAGAVWVFTRSGSVWTQQGSKLTCTGNVGNVSLGRSIAISSDGKVLAAGGPADNNGTGAVWIFTNNNGTWGQLGSKLVGSGYYGLTNEGTSVYLSSDGSTVIFGGPGDNGDVGASWVFNDASIGIRMISGEVPKEYSLSQNYPNPFNPSTNIEFEIRPPLTPLLSKEGTGVVLKIYDILGREVTTLVNEKLQAGSYKVDWNASNYTSGVYFYKLQTTEFTQTKKMILIK